MHEELKRIENKIDHQHDMLHTLVESQWYLLEILEELTECGTDQGKILALSKTVRKKTAALKAAVKANQPATPPNQGP